MTEKQQETHILDTQANQLRKQIRIAASVLNLAETLLAAMLDVTPQAQTTSAISVRATIEEVRETTSREVKAVQEELAQLLARAVSPELRGEAVSESEINEANDDITEQALVQINRLVTVGPNLVKALISIAQANAAGPEGTLV